MAICRTISLIALILAGVRRSDSVAPPYRNTCRCSLNGATSAQHAFIKPVETSLNSLIRRIGRNDTKGDFARCADRNGGELESAISEEEDGDGIKQPSRVHDDQEDHTTIHEELEQKSIDYIDRRLFDDNKGESSSSSSSSEGGNPKNSEDKKGSDYFNWDKVRDNRNLTSDEIVKSVDSTGTRELEKGKRPVITGHGTDMEIHIEAYPTNVDTGRLNEWNPEWVPDEKIMSFFPILIDEYSLLPSPLQVGFEDPVTFRGKYVDMTFNSLLDTTTFPGGQTKQIYGMCFINPTSGQLAPLAVYAELISREAFVDGGGERLKVKGRILGRVILHQVIMEEPFIKAKIIPMEDNPNFTNAAEVPKLVDEITNLHESCSKVECEMMEVIEQPYAVARIKSRPNLHDLIDERLNHFKVDIQKGAQAFAQIAAYTAFDYHMTADERYDALVMQDSFDRLRYVRDCLRMKLKQLNILKKAPREKLDGIVEQMKQMQLNRDDALAKVMKEDMAQEDK